MEKKPRVEIKCDICKASHSTAQHEGWTKVETIKKASLEQLHKGEPGVVEALKETQLEGMLGVDKDTLKEESLKKLHGEE